MSSRLLGWCWAQQIKPAAKLVLMALNEYTRYSDHGDWRVFPSQKTLSAMTGMTEFTIRKHMQELEQAGILKIAHQFDGNGRQMQNIYWLMAPDPQDLGGKNLSGGGERNFRGEGKETCDDSLNKESLDKSNRRKAPKPFKAPSVDEVAEYAKDNRLLIDPKFFHSYFETADWHDAQGKPVKNWKQKALTWHKRESTNADGKKKSTVRSRV